MRSTPLCLFVALALGGCSTSLSKYFDTEAGTRPGEPDGEYAVGKQELIAGHYGLAIESLTGALAQQPRSIPILNGLAVAYAKLGRAGTAKRYFAEALSVDPHSPVTLTNIAYFELNNGNAAEAMSFARRAEAESGTHQQVHTDLSPTVLAAIDGNLARATSAAGRYANSAGQDAPPAGPAQPVPQPIAAGATAASPARLAATEPSVPDAGPALTVDARATRKSSVSEVAVTSAAPLDALASASPIALAVADREATPRIASTEYRIGGAAAGSPAVAQGLRDNQAANPGPTHQSAPIARTTSGGSAATASTKSSHDVRLAAVAPAAVGPSAGEGAKRNASKAHAGPAKPAAPEGRGSVAQALEPMDGAFRVSNGVGVPRLAGRTAEYLSGYGIKVRYVTNEARFDRPYSVIYYDPRLAASAQQLADALPMHPDCVQVSPGSGQVELVLGADALNLAADFAGKPRRA